MPSQAEINTVQRQGTGGPFGEVEQLVQNEFQLVQRPDVFKRIAWTAAGTLAAAYYYNMEGFRDEAFIKAIYAFFGAGLGVNIGMQFTDTRMDAVGAGLAYYGLNVAGQYFRFSSFDSTLKYEAIGAVLAGLAADYAANMGSGCSCGG